MNINKTGIKAQQLALNAISNNIANVSTEGYKAKGVRFQSLLNNQVTDEDVLLNGVTPSISTGVRSEVAVTNHSQGTLRDGANTFNFAIAGDCFFAVEDGAGERFLTKDGSFMLDGTGRLVNGNGHYLVMDGAIPAMTSGNESLSVARDGTLAVTANGVTTEVGRLNIFMATNLQGLQPVGENSELINLLDANVQINRVELSNVDLAQELTNMLIAQRAYSLNVRVAQSTDEMMSIINQFSI